MRLFTAITLPEEVKKKLYESSKAIGQKCESSNFARYENYHITLVFLGEVEKEKVSTVKQILDDTAKGFDAFDLSCTDIDYFTKKNRKILYYNVELDIQTLREVQLTLYNKFHSEGLCRIQDAYTPHITFARQAKIKKLPSIDQSCTFKAERITLMHSTRVDDKLTYLPIYSSKLCKRE